MRDADLTFKDRNTGRIDLAQTKMEEFLDKKGFFHKRFGWDEKEDKIPTEQWEKFPRFIQGMPDTIVVTNKLNFLFLESKGCKEYCGIKIRDLESYRDWSKVGPLYISIYSTTTKSIYIPHLNDIQKLIDDGLAKRDQYNNGPIFYKISTEHLEKWSKKNEM